MEEDHLKVIHLKDETFIRPPPNPKYMRIYGHPICPYVERLKHMLTMKNIPFQCAFVDLPSRPEWFKVLGSKGAVPVVELPNSEFFLYESIACAGYIEDAYPEAEYKFFPKDPLLRAKLQIVIAKTGSFVTEFYKVLKDFGETKDMAKDMVPILEQIEGWLKLNKEGQFFMDQKEPSVADVFLLPHFSRLMLMMEEGTPYAEIIKNLDIENKFPSLFKWRKDMQKFPGIAISEIDKVKFVGWITKYLAIRDIPKSLTLGEFC